MMLVAFDIENPGVVAHELAEANRKLAREHEVPPSILALVEDLCDQLSITESSALERVDPYLWIALQQAALRALRAVQENDPRTQRQRIRVSLEELRFLLTRLAEREAVGEDREPTEIVRWLDQVLTVPQRRKADLLGVAERTYQRWLSERAPTHPDSDDECRLRLVARIVNQLRHMMTGPGVVAWLERPRDDLDGLRPLDLLDDVTATDRLLDLAAASRSSTAT